MEMYAKISLVMLGREKLGTLVICLISNKIAYSSSSKEWEENRARG